MSSTPAPRTIRVAGGIVAAQGCVGLAVGVLLVARALPHPGAVGAVFGEAAYFMLLGGGVAAAGVGLLRSRRWARTPSLLLQLLLLGAAWYAVGPSGVPQYGIPVALLCLLVAGLLLSPAARGWASAEWRSSHPERSARDR